MRHTPRASTSPTSPDARAEPSSPMMRSATPSTARSTVCARRSTRSEGRTMASGAPSLKPYMLMNVALAKASSRRIICTDVARQRGGLVHAQAVVDKRRDATGPHDSEERDEPVDGVVAPKRHAIALGNAHLVQVGGKSGHRRIELPVRDGFVFGNDCQAFVIPMGQHVGEQHIESLLSGCSYRTSAGSYLSEGNAYRIYFHIRLNEKGSSALCVGGLHARR